MRVVLYADDMEPITVIELPRLAESYLKEKGYARLVVPLALPSLTIAQAATTVTIRTVGIRAERFIRKGQTHLILFTCDEESALLLKCAFLPGQMAEVQDQESISLRARVRGRSRAYWALACTGRSCTNNKPYRPYPYHAAAMPAASEWPPTPLFACDTVPTTPSVMPLIRRTPCRT